MNRPIATTIDGEEVAIDPARAGLAVDYDASVAEAGGERSWTRCACWNYFTGGDDFEAEVDVDERRSPPSSPSSTSSTAPRPVTAPWPSTGSTSAPPRRAPARHSTRATRSPALQEAYLATAPEVVALEMSEVVPDIDAGDVREALDGFASPGCRRRR